MSEATCLPTTTWFLYSEDDVPLGRIYRSSDPQVEVRVEDGPGFGSCAMRRFKVVVRVLT